MGNWYANVYLGSAAAVAVSALTGRITNPQTIRKEIQRWKSFGCDSSREQAPVALKTAGSAVVARSFARIFFSIAQSILGFLL